MNNVLLIVASGKSSRFGGFPKAFCDINGKTNIENTILKAKKYVDKVYVGVNKKVYEQYNSKVKGCELFSIKTGQGDAHSLLKCLKYIREKEGNIEKILVCWGDAVFISSKPFEELLQYPGNVQVACSVDVHPYAWFDVVENDVIVKSHFAKEEGEVEEGLHDQSIFYFDINFTINYLEKYKDSLMIVDDNDEEVSDINEMKLLFFFEYLYSCKTPAKCIEITKNQVLSFNTQSELDNIKDIMNI